MIRLLLGLPVIVFMALLAYGAISGRVRAKSCCSIADPNADLRIRDDVRSAGPATGSPTA